MATPLVEVHAKCGIVWCFLINLLKLLFKIKIIIYSNRYTYTYKHIVHTHIHIFMHQLHMYAYMQMWPGVFLIVLKY